MADMYERSSQLRLSLRSIDTALKCAQKAKDKFTEWEAIEKKARVSHDLLVRWLSQGESCSTGSLVNFHHNLDILIIKQKFIIRVN